MTARTMTARTMAMTARITGEDGEDDRQGRRCHQGL
jgi:hypothetical protein